MWGIIRVDRDSVLIRKLILCLVVIWAGAWSLQAQVNSRDPQKSPTFQTTCDNEINNEPVAKAVPVQSSDTPAPAATAMPAQQIGRAHV